MRPRALVTPFRIALIALPLALVAIPAAPSSDLYRLESRISYLEGQIRDLRTQRPIERQFRDTDTDRRLRNLENEIVSLRRHIGLLEERIAVMGADRSRRVAPTPAKPDDRQ